jgi:hypothetical protein
MDEEAFFSDFLAAVEQQLQSPQTPYVTKTLKRLVQGGLEESEAKERIAECLAEEMDVMYRRRRGFDEKSYRTRLNELTAAPRPVAAEEASTDEAPADEATTEQTKEPGPAGQDDE